MSRQAATNPGTPFGGRKVVTTAGTAVAVTSTVTVCHQVDITAEEDNTGLIAVGDSGVIAALETRKGVYLSKGDTYTLYDVDLSKVYLDATVNGDGVTYSGVAL